MRHHPRFQYYDGGPTFYFLEKVFYKTRFLGNGGFGTVSLFQSYDGTCFALKSEIPFNHHYPSGYLFEKEAYWYHKIYDFGLFSGNPRNHSTPHYILMPYIEGKPLYQISYTCIRELFSHWIKIANFVNTQHQKHHAIHCDLKSDNIIIFEKDAFLIDFGYLTKVNDDRKDCIYDTTSNKKSYWHQPPEIFSENPSCLKAQPAQDIYSLGMMLDNTYNNQAIKTNSNLFVNRYDLLIRKIKTQLTTANPTERLSIPKAIYMIIISFFSSLPKEILQKPADEKILDNLAYFNLLPDIWQISVITALQIGINRLFDEQKKIKSELKKEKIDGLKLIESRIKKNGTDSLEELISEATKKFPRLTSGFFSTRTKKLLEQLISTAPLLY